MDEINIGVSSDSSYKFDTTFDLQFDLIGGTMDLPDLPDPPDQAESSANDNEHERKFKKLCPDYAYQPMILPSQKRIIVIGDIHGDMDLAEQSLKLGKVIDDSGNWIGGETVVVQIGDQIDSCRPLPDKKCDHPDTTVNDKAEDLKILKYFTDLHNKASEHGGSVYSLFGNHELMNALGNINYVSYENINSDPELKKYQKDNNMEDQSLTQVRKQMFKPGSEYGNFMACTRVSSLIIGSFLFVHAGIVKKYTDEMDIKGREDLIKLDRKVKKWLLGLINKDYVDKIVTSFKYSLFWDRILGGIPPNLNNNDPKCIKHLKDVLELFKVGKMVIGHTPQFFGNNEGINKTCGKSLWRVDIGGSTAFSNFDEQLQKDGEIMDLRRVQVLEIIDDKKINILK